MVHRHGLLSALWAGCVSFLVAEGCDVPCILVNTLYLQIAQAASDI